MPQEVCLYFLPFSFGFGVISFVHFYFPLSLPYILSSLLLLPATARNAFSILTISVPPHPHDKEIDQITSARANQKCFQVQQPCRRTGEKHPCPCHLDHCHTIATATNPLPRNAPKRPFPMPWPLPTSTKRKHGRVILFLLRLQCLHHCCCRMGWSRKPGYARHKRKKGKCKGISIIADRRNSKRKEDK